MKKNIFSRLIAMTLIAMSIISIALPASATTAQTKTSAVNIRSGPGKSYSLVGQVAEGTTFTVDEEVTGSILNNSNVWLKISNIKCAEGSKHNIDGKSGYVHSSYVSGYSVSGGNSGSETPTPTGPHIDTNAVNIRSAASTSATLIGQVAKYTTLTVHYETTGTEIDGDSTWLNVTIIKCASGSKNNIDGKTGFVHSSFVSGYTTSGSSTGNNNAKPTSMETAFGEVTLKYGSKGNAVKNVQLVLSKEKLYFGDIDGQYGPNTTTAVEDYQARYCELLGAENEYDATPIDGLVGPKTKDLMWRQYGDYLKQYGYRQ